MREAGGLIKFGFEQEPSVEQFPGGATLQGDSYADPTSVCRINPRVLKTNH
jgi:hypothetical protein